MRITRTFAVLAGLCFATALAAQPAPVQAAPVQSASDSEADKDVKSLWLRLSDLMVKGNWDDYEKHLAPDFTRISDSGALEDKEQVMASFKNGPRKIIIIEPENVHVRTYGGTAVVQGTLTVSVRESGRVTTRRESTTDVFIKRDSEWSMVAEQQTASK
jgi:Domain of unknown function (DUF4440)